LDYFLRHPARLNKHVSVLKVAIIQEPHNRYVKSMLNAKMHSQNLSRWKQ